MSVPRTRVSTAGPARTASARTLVHALPGSAVRLALIQHNRAVSARARTTRPGLTLDTTGVHAPGLPRTVSTTVRGTAPGERTQRGSRQRSPAQSHARAAAPSPTMIAVRCQRISDLHAASYISLILLLVLSHVSSSHIMSSCLSHLTSFMLLSFCHFSFVSCTFISCLCISLSDLSSRLGLSSFHIQLFCLSHLLLPRFSHSVTFLWFLAHSSHVSRISLSDLSSRLGSHTDNRGSFAP